MTPPDPHTTSAGPYVTGALSAAERVSFEEHLGGCRTCRDEVARLAPLPGLLRRVAPPATTTGAAQAAGATTPPAVARRITDRRVAQRRQRRRISGAAVLAVVAAAAAAVVVPISLRSQPSVPARLVALTGPQASGTAELDRRAWGTEVVLRLTALPPGSRVVARVAPHAGAAEMVGAWVSPANGRAEVEVATDLPATAIDRVTLTDASTGAIVADS